MYDFVYELGYLALATRFKRLSEAMVHSGREMYKELGLDVEPNWFLIFKLLKKYETLSVTQIANKLHFSHPSVITLISKMEQNGYLQSSSDDKDARKKNYTLTDKAHEKLPQLEEIWHAGTVATTTATSGLRPAERHLMSKNFSAPRSAPNPASVTV